MLGGFLLRFASSARYLPLSNLQKTNDSLLIAMKLKSACFLIVFAMTWLPALVARADQLPPNTKVLRDLEYVPGGGHSRSLDLYVPEAKPGVKIPLVIWIHGGAWRGGSKEGNHALWLLKDGFATASINYRLSNEVRFPGQIEDCKAAVRFLRAHAAEYGFDGDHIGVWGSSAGGHLALLLGTTGGVRALDGNNDAPSVSSRVQAVCDFFGPTDLLTTSSQAGPQSQVQHDDPSAPEAELIGGPVQQNPEKALAASPVNYVTPEDPPFLIVHGENDQLVPVGQSWELYGMLQKAGVKSEIHIVAGGGHGDHFNSKEIGSLVRDFFQKYLKTN
jgi:acetyl esterase/lipase